MALAEQVPEIELDRGSEDYRAVLGGGEPAVADYTVEAQSGVKVSYPRY